MSPNVNGVHNGIMLDFQGLYDSTLCSDVKIVIPGRPKNIFAHRVILAAGSDTFRHELSFTNLEGEPATHLRLDNRVGNEIETVEIGIKHIYGIKVLDEGSPSCPKSLGALARIGIFAEQYKIAGLLEAVFEATTRSLMDCLSDGGKLDLLFRCHVRSFHQSTKDAGAFFRFATKMFGDNIDKLYNMAVFQRLLVEIPRLALDILNYVAEKQSKVKDSK